MPDMNDATSLLIASPADHGRFGLNVMRAVLESSSCVAGAAARIAAEIEESSADIVILRAPVDCTALVRDLVGLGYPPLNADTLVYYEKLLDTTVSQVIAPYVDIDASLAHPTHDLDAISEIARSAFSGYKSHYSANPLFDPRLVEEGYVEWAVSQLGVDGAEPGNWVARKNGRAIAFIACRDTTTPQECEIVLNAVDPVHAGRGVYRYLLAHSMGELRRKGYERLIISTQIWNYAVQKAWSRCGMNLYRAYATYHINSLLGVGHSRAIDIAGVEHTR